MDVIHVRLGVDGHEEAFAQLHETLALNSKSIAAVVIEPIVQGTAGMRTYPAQYLVRLRKLTREFGILLVADEVFTGYGRTGPFWACEHADVIPDILCTAKGFSGRNASHGGHAYDGRNSFDAFRFGDKSRNILTMVILFAEIHWVQPWHAKFYPSIAMRVF